MNIVLHEPEIPANTGNILEEPVLQREQVFI